MRILKSIIFVVVMTAGSLFTPFLCAAQLKCNTGIADITPNDPVSLAGFAARKGLSTTTHRPLKTHCLVIQRDTTRVCIITNDMMEISIDLAKKLRLEIADKTGIPYNHIFIHCIHTHSAPRTGGKSVEQGEPNFAFVTKFRETVVSNAVQTANNKKAFIPFTIETAKGSSNINCNRRESDGPCDHDVYVARLLDKKGKPIVSLLNFACHPVSLNHKSLVVSTDFPGIAREELSKTWNSDVFYFAGPAGNVDPCGPLRADTAYTQSRGIELADAVRNIKFNKLKKNNVLRISNMEVELPFRAVEITPELINNHADEIKNWDPFGTWKNDVERWRVGTLEKIANGEVKNYLPVEIASVNIGGLVLLFTQGEPFNEYQTILRESRPDVPILFIAYTNGQNSYLPSQYAFGREGYEYEKEQMHIYIGAPYPLSDKMPEVYEMSIMKAVNDVIENNALSPENLRCEYLADPSGIDVLKPHLSFLTTSKLRNQNQKAYRILVSSSLEKLNSDVGDLWDSKKVESDQSINIVYDGEKLTSGQECYWKVKVWNDKGKESEWSKPAKWSMGLLDKSDWKGYWIGLDSLIGNDKKFSLSARYLRKEFNAEKTIKRATAYICGLGLFDLYINGAKIGNQVLAPALSEYLKRSYYMTFDVTKEINTGQNAIGVLLGSGRYFSPVKWDQHYGFPKMIFQLNITYADGTKQSIVSDSSWELTADGPIRMNNEFDGEEYDARKEMPGWNNINYVSTGWMKAQKVDEPSKTLSAQMIDPIRIKETIKPKSIKEIKPGVYVYDMGQNMVGWVSLKVTAPEGTKITLRFAETIHPDGELNTANLRLAKQTDVYITKGEGLEKWQPNFTYHGFRYVELSGFPGKPDLNTLEGKVIYDDIRTIGTFNCSSDIINKIYNAAYWGIRGNYRSVPTDCPQRDERQAWLGDRTAGSLGESYLFDINALYTKWMTDIADGQKENGSISDVNPTYRKVYSDNVTWPSTFILAPYYLYQQFGNKKVISQQYDAMKKWIYYMRDNYMKNNLLPRDSYGDWCMVSENRNIIHSKDSATITPGAFLGSAYFYYDLTQMEKYARLLGMTDDAEAFAALSGKMKEAINTTFLDKDHFYYANNTITANVIALYFELAPTELKNKVFENIVHRIEHDFDYHTSCGAVGQQWLMRTLTENGSIDLALKIAENTSYPSFGYMIEHGATTIWELWNGDTAPPAMNSANHVMLLGDFVTWLYQVLGGINIESGSPGYKNIILKPYPVKGLNHVNAAYNSVHGLIKSSWKKADESFIWDISIPCNTIATVYVPSPLEKNVTESGKKVSSVKGIKYIRADKGYAVYKVGSGDYQFIVK